VRKTDPKPTDTVLEVAAGTCVTGRSLAPHAAHVVCLDATPAMLEIGRAEAQKAGINNITFMKEDTIIGGDQNKSHLSVGYTFTKADFTLADLVDSADVDNYRRQITDYLGKTLVKHPNQLFDFLLIGEDCRSQGMVPLPANGAFLQDDSLVFIYQEYEIAPYKAGRPYVKLPYKRRPVATSTNTLPSDSDSLAVARDSVKTDSSATKQAKPEKSKSETKKSESSKKTSKSERKSKKTGNKSSKSKKSDKKTSKK